MTDRRADMLEAWAIARRRMSVYGESAREALSKALSKIYQTRRWDAAMAAKREACAGGVRSSMSSGFEAPVDPMSLARWTA